MAEVEREVNDGVGIAPASNPEPERTGAADTIPQRALCQDISIDETFNGGYEEPKEISARLTESYTRGYRNALLTLVKPMLRSLKKNSLESRHAESKEGSESLDGAASIDGDEGGVEDVME